MDITGADMDIMNSDLANRVYDVLVKYAGAHDDEWARRQFVYAQTNGFCSEYRFQGMLGFGGKYWRNRLSGVGRVDCYKEDETPGRLVIIQNTNNALQELAA